MALDEKFRSILTNCPHYYDIINYFYAKRHKKTIINQTDNSL